MNIINKGMNVLFLAESEVEQIGITMKETVDTIERVFGEYEKKDAIVPPKVFLDMKDFGYSCDGDAMPAYVNSCKMCGVKWIGGSEKNREMGIPYLFATIILTNPETFLPIAVIGGNWLTAMRTGAATAVAAKYLAKKRSEKVGIIGTGYQARFQLMGLNEVFRIKEAKVVDVRTSVMKNYTKEMSEKLGLKVETADNAKDVVEDADIVITATTADEPLVKYEWMKKGCFVCAIGTYSELEYKVVKSMDKIVVDHLEQATYTGSLAKWFSKNFITKREIYAELGEIVAGRKAGRVSDTENILCVSTGMACEDIALGYRVYELAKEKGVGQLIRWL